MNLAKLSKKNQDELISEEMDRLLEVFSGLPNGKLKIAKRLIERIAFMKVTLEVLENNIKTKGPTYLFKNGSQKMHVENPAQKSYNTMINRYTSACEKLFNLLPRDVDEGKHEVVDEVDDFEDF
ncbi:hypothetical protein [Fictibacillus sp. JL2B1089]|uniref:hypothetical protein n=1 Tax=Fictibacillus sp. JL2B1089 TaxID=3399565 RepID=UPI003A83AA6B